VAVGDRTNLKDLYGLIKDSLAEYGYVAISDCEYADFRTGDVKHSLANIDKTKSLLGYLPSHTVSQGLHPSMAWYAGNHD
jgi:UDP-N-acetylglucosamine 4-epimerase